MNCSFGVYFRDTALAVVIFCDVTRLALWAALTGGKSAQPDLHKVKTDSSQRLWRSHVITVRLSLWRCVRGVPSRVHCRPNRVVPLLPAQLHRR